MPEGIYCFILCFGIALGDAKTQTVGDTFCKTYVRVVTSQAEVNEVLKLPRKMRDRIQGNDLDYLCRCQGWKDIPNKKALCASTTP